MPTLQNAVITELREFLFSNPNDCPDHSQNPPSGCWLTTKWFNEVYAATSTGSPLRKLAINYIKYAVTHFPDFKTHFAEHSSDIPREMSLEITQDLLFGGATILDVGYYYALKNCLVEEDNE